MLEGVVEGVRRPPSIFFISSDGPTRAHCPKKGWTRRSTGWLMTGSDSKLSTLPNLPQVSPTSISLRSSITHDKNRALPLPTP